ncbi:MAG: GldG family protein [Nitrospirae bacterium]|nr:GldG family protein [Nitrospirota bacterium]
MKRKFFDLFRGFSTRRSARFGANSILMVAIFASILGILNFISYNHYHRLDLSYNRDFTLSPQTISVLKNLTKDIKITGFFQEGSQTKGQFKGLLETYMYHTKRIKFDFIDPDKEPAVAKRYKVNEYDTILLESGEKEARAKTTGEQELTNAIIRVTRNEKRSVYFVEGHGEHGVDDIEKSGISQARDILIKQGLDVKKLILLQEGKIPADTSILVIAGPQKPFLPAEKDLLLDYINGGGQILLMIDPVTTSGIEEILKKLGVKLGNDVIIDPISRILGGGLNIPVVSSYPEHHITNNFNIVTFFPVARSIGFDPGDSKDIYFEPVIQTSPSSWAETDLDKRDAEFDPKKDTRGPVTIGATVTLHEKEGIDAPKEKRFRLVVFGDSDFSSNAWFSSSGNGDLFLNSVNWLAREEDIISITPKEVKGSRLLLTRAEGRRLFIIPVLLLPSLVLISGLIIWRKRRRL